MVKKKKKWNDPIHRVHKTVSRKRSMRNTQRGKKFHLDWRALANIYVASHSSNSRRTWKEKERNGKGRREARKVWRHVSYGRGRTMIEVTFVHLPDWKVDPTIRGWNDRMGRGRVREAVKTVAACEEILGSRLKSIALSRPVFVRGKGAADRHARGFTRGGVAVRL